MKTKRTAVPAATVPTEITDVFDELLTSLGESEVTSDDILGNLIALDQMLDVRSYDDAVELARVLVCACIPPFHGERSRPELSLEVDMLFRKMLARINPILEARARDAEETRAAANCPRCRSAEDSAADCASNS